VSLKTNAAPNPASSKTSAAKPYRPGRGRDNPPPFCRPHAESADHGHFIGGSDARIIMDDDKAALLRLWAR
jgi:hypothetical protein